jgi:soluble lytic murein transglycosylase-like protein
MLFISSYNRELRVLLIVALIAVPVVQAEAAAGDTYIYRENDGTIWYTNTKPVGVEPNKYQLIGIYGRTTATASCSGMTAARMETRARLYADDINRYAKKYGVNRLLVKAIISVESCFDSRAISRAGARGLMQLMPDTARYLGVSNVFDQQQNIRGGVRYFSEMRKRFNYDNLLALAAYNAGPTAVDKYAGVPPYRETIDYVARVMKKYREYIAIN